MRYRLRLDRLAALLAASRLSQNHWAIRLGLSRGHWSDIVNGRHPVPSAKTRQRLLDTFGVPLEELFELEPAAATAELDFRMAIAPRFELQSELGHGGMGTVYVAHDHQMGRPVALKVVSAEASAGLGAERLLQEIALASRLHHPHVLPVFDAGVRAGQAYYVMPVVRGGSLAHRLRSGQQLSPRQVVEIAQGVAAALDHAHAQRVLHCDVKPENILLDGDHAWVMDFGLARRLHDGDSEHDASYRDLDLSAGTPAYVSPEQASGVTDLDPRSDLYSFACVVYQMLTGALPYPGTTTREVVSRRFAEPAAPLQLLAPELPDAMVQAVERALSLDREHRQHSVGEFAAELRQSLGEEKRSASPIARLTAIARRRSQRAAAPLTLSHPTANAMRRHLDSLRQDANFAVRFWLRRKVVSLSSAGALAAGIGLAVAMFATVRGVLLAPLPFADPERLVVLQSVDSAGRAFSLASAADAEDWRTGTRSLEGIGLYNLGGRVAIGAEGGAVRATARMVSPSFFDVLRPAWRWGQGSAVGADGPERPVVVSEGFWRRALGASTARPLTLRVNGSVRTVVGVVASGHELPAGTDVWLPTPLSAFAQGGRNNINWVPIARLRAGVTVRQAADDLARVAAGIRAVDPSSLYSHGVRVRGLREELTGDAGDTVWLLSAAVMLVLLVACANTATAQLSIGAARRREMGVRVALGSSRARLVRQLFIEQGVVALVAGVLGTLLAWALLRGVAFLDDSGLPRLEAITVDGWVLALAATLVVVVTMLTGLVPVFQAGRVSPVGAMGRDRGTAEGGRGMPGRALIVAELAMALILAGCASLVIRSLQHVLSRPLGFDPRGVATVEVTLGDPRYQRDRLAASAYWDRLLSALRAQPGVRSAALAEWVPLVFGGTGFVDVEGKDIPGAGAGYRAVGPGYFATLGVPVLGGRDFEERDGRGTPRVALVNEAMAAAYWPGESPIGKRVRAASMEPRGEWITVIGVVGNVRHFGYESEMSPEMFVYHRQLDAWHESTLTALVRGEGESSALLASLSGAVRSVDPSIPADVALLDAAADRLTAPRRFTVRMLGLFGALALLLAALGVYGVLSFHVTRRTRELAVRTALGAQRRQLLRLVLRAALSTIGAGVVIGLAGLAGLSRLVESLLFGVEPLDVYALAIAATAVVVAALAAAWLPAMRATRVGTFQALKVD